MQSHIHPVILSLGIILLEIATGARFRRSSMPGSWERCNADNIQALNLLEEKAEQGRKDRSKKIPTGLHNAILRCLKLEPPANFATNQLSKDGPIRQYILTCIIQPLADELIKGHGLRLEEVHELAPEKESEAYGSGLTQTSAKRLLSSWPEEFSRFNMSGMVFLLCYQHKGLQTPNPKHSFLLPSLSFSRDAILRLSL
jgi:hypothetical protein